MELKDLKDDSVEVRLNNFQTLVVHFADEGVVHDVWDVRYSDAPVYSTWKLYTEFEVLEEDIKNDKG